MKGAGINEECGVNTHTPLRIKRVANKELPYSTGKSAPCFLITYKGKESEKINRVMVTESRRCTPETNTML